VQASDAAARALRVPLRIELWGGATGRLETAEQIPLLVALIRGGACGEC